MKKISKFLFTSLFAVVGIFGMGNVKADEIPAVKLNEKYEFYLKDSTNKLTMEVASGDTSIFETALRKFYEADKTPNGAYYVPLNITVKNGETWNSASDSATLYINIPNYLEAKDKASGTNFEHVYLVRISANGTNSAYSINNRFNNNKIFEVKSKADIQSAIDSATVSGIKPMEGYFSGDFLVANLSDLNPTGTTNYMLVACVYGTQQTTTTTQQTTTTQSKITESTTTTTVENPKTADVGNQLYIVLGTVCLVAIVGLGVKFAKANK